jgi:single-stranded-DNA-specific exonuclease
MLKKQIERFIASAHEPQFSSEVHPLLQRVYLNRQVSSSKQVQTDLSVLPRPDLMKGLDKACIRLYEALKQREKIVIVGDFDADGATSTTLASLALEAMGFSRVGFVVPNRFEYGYGLTPEIVDVVAMQRPDLILTVDNGISSVDGVAAARKRGLDVIVTDHHLPGRVLPDALAIVNPNQSGCEFPSKSIAGVGVVFYLMLALRAYLRDQGWFEANKLQAPNMAEYLDLVALGTVADVVPLDAVNRVLVYQGLQRIRAGRCRPGILALLAIAKRDYRFVVAQDMGFAVAPRLNAAGRLDDMSLGIGCLLTQSEALAQDMARELDSMNQERRQIEQLMQAEALQILASVSLDERRLPPIICLYHDQWHQGVIGILASRIKERYHRPVIAFAPAELDAGEEARQLKGSARSIDGVHMRDLLDRVATQNPGLIEKFGGHAMAAGLALDADDFLAFQHAAVEILRSECDEAVFDALILTDGELAVSDFNLYTALALETGGPWGQQFPEPCFDGEFYLLQQRVVGEKHIKAVLAPAANKQQVVDAIAFNADLALWQSEPARLRLVFKLDINRFRGQESLQLMIEYAEPCV